MPPVASSGAPLAIPAKAKIVQRPKITHGIKRPHERFMIKSKLADATSGCESVKGRAAASRFKPGKPGKFTALPARNGDAADSQNIQTITSDNICHIKSAGVGSDCRRTQPRRALKFVS